MPLSYVRFAIAPLKETHSHLIFYYIYIHLSSLTEQALNILDDGFLKTDV